MRFVATLIMLFAMALPASATVMTVDFDSLPAVTDNLHPGKAFASSGVVFSTLFSINNVVARRSIASEAGDIALVFVCEEQARRG